MKISLFLEVGSDPIESADLVVDAEAAGIDMVWVPEAYGFDGVSLLGYLAARTERIELASGILPLGTRTATLLAMTAAGIDKVSGGRFTLGLGTSGPQVIEGMHGITFDRPIARTRDVIEICRLVWQREPIIYEGSTIKLPPGTTKPLRLLAQPVRERVPITIASMGPKNVELTAELAEGWLPMFGMFHPDGAADVWGDALAAGNARRSPDLPPLDVVAGGPVVITDDPEPYRVAARRSVAFYVGGMGSREKNFYNELMQRYGFAEAAAEIQDKFLGGDRAGAAAAVPQEFIDAVSLCGSEDFVRKQVARYRDAGVTNLIVSAAGDDKPGTFRQLRTIVDDVG